MKFDADYIEKLAEIIADKGLTEISLEDGNQAITMRKDLYTGAVQVAAPQVVAAPQAAAPVATPAAAPAPNA